MVNLVKSGDGCIRSPKVSLPSGRIIGRPLKPLFPIEVCQNTSHLPDSHDTQKIVPPNQNEPFRHSVQTAAKHAKLKIKQILSD